MELPANLVPVLWGAVAVLGVSAIVFMTSLNILSGGHRRLALRVVWISGSVMMAAGIAVIILLLH